MSARTILAVGALLAAACTGQETKAAKEAPALAPVAAPAPEARAESVPTPISQAEADAKAKAAISRENADAELEKLKKELAGGG